MKPANVQVTTVVYTAISHLLPTLGRDFKVEIDAERKDDSMVDTKIRIIPMTPLGELMVPYIKEHLPATIANAVINKGSNGTDDTTKDNGSVDTEPVP